MSMDRDLRVEALKGVGPEISAILLQERERTNANSINIIDVLEKQVAQLTAERNHYMTMAQMYHEAERCRRAAWRMGEDHMKQFPLY